MKVWFAHHGNAGLAGLEDELTGLGRPLTLADRACCCPARPAVTVIMPPAPGRPHPVDLLLCGHHYRASRAALRAAGATVYDENGMLVSDAGKQPASRREPAAAGARSRPLPRLRMSPAQGGRDCRKACWQENNASASTRPRPPTMKHGQCGGEKQSSSAAGSCPLRCAGTGRAMSGDVGPVPRLIVGISRSRASWWALAWAIGEARRRQARLLLVHVFRPPLTGSAWGYDQGYPARPGTRTPTAWQTATR